MTVAEFGTIISAVGILLLVYQTYIARKALERGADSLAAATRANELAATDGAIQAQSDIQAARFKLSEACEERDKGTKSQEYVDTCIEAYLNAIERLCGFLRYGVFDDRVFETEYRLVLLQAIQRNPRLFQEGTPYQNIKHVNDCWQNPSDKKRVADRVFRRALDVAPRR